MSDLTRILAQVDERYPAAAEQLFTLVYEELRKLAAVLLACETPGQTLQATAVVHGFSLEEAADFVGISSATDDSREAIYTPMEGE